MACFLYQEPSDQLKYSLLPLYSIAHVTSFETQAYFQLTLSFNLRVPWGTLEQLLIFALGRLVSPSVCCSGLWSTLWIKWVAGSSTHVLWHYTWSLSRICPPWNRVQKCSRVDIQCRVLVHFPHSVARHVSCIKDVQRSVADYSHSPYLGCCL